MTFRVRGPTPDVSFYVGKCEQQAGQRSKSIFVRDARARSSLRSAQAPLTSRAPTGASWNGLFLFMPAVLGIVRGQLLLQVGRCWIVVGEGHGPAAVTCSHRF